MDFDSGEFGEGKSHAKLFPWQGDRDWELQELQAKVTPSLPEAALNNRGIWGALGSIN